MQRVDLDFILLKSGLFVSTTSGFLITSLTLRIAVVAYPELVKEVDFNFSSGTASFSYVPELLITSSEIMEFYSMWESNFLSYVEMGVFDEIKVTVD